jgi:hypothetical protein
MTNKQVPPCTSRFAAVQLAYGQIRVAAEQMEGNFFMVIQQGFLANPFKAGHLLSFSEKGQLG